MDVQRVKENLDRRITLRSVTRIPDDHGGLIETYTDTVVWASKSFRGGDGGNEYQEGGVVRKNQDIVFTIRYRDIQYYDKVVFQGETYDIQRVEDAGGRNNYLRLYCNTDE